LRRAALDRVFWGALAAPVELTAESLPQLTNSDIMLVCDQALNMLRPLRGEDAARIVHLLEMWPVRAHITRMLAKGRRGARIRMLTLLAHFSDAETLALLKQSIGDPDFYVQLAALRSLAARKAIEALPQILAQLEHARRQNTAMLADVLRRFDEPAIEMLIQLAIGAAQPEVRLAAIRAMDAIGSLQAVPALISLAADPLADIRAESIAALGHLGDMSAEPAVFHALSDKEEAVRVRAAKAAGRLHLRTASPLLAAMLSDTSWWVRYRAAEALYQMGAIGQSFLQTRSRETDLAAHTAAQLLAEKEAA
jgi:HEAT repeat protein